MKIVAGELGGRTIAQPKSRSVRPMSEKVRAAIFDVIGSVEGYTVLDAYAGSGAAGFEALSRGALLAEGIETNPVVAKTIQANEKDLGFGFSYILHQISLETWLASPAQQPPKPHYDLIIADPPYMKLEEDLLEKLAHYLNPQGILVVSHAGKMTSPVLQSVGLKQHKVYGDSALSFYQAE
jgi:16S rRNA (guanine966-N2)-methyltransferase